MSKQGSIQYLLTVFLTFALARAQISIEVTQKAFSHVFKKEISELHDAVIRYRPSPFQSSYLGLELTVDHLQVVHFKTPSVIYETSSSPHKFFVKMLGGSSRILGQYSAIYKTKRDGQFELILDHFDLTMPVDFATMSSRGECSLRIDDVTILMTPALPEQITKMIRNDIIEKIEKQACEVALTFMESVSQKMKNAFEVTDISQGNRPTKFDFRIVPIESTVDHPHAFHIDVSDSVINGELSKLYSSAETRFFWNDVPEIKEMLANCEQPECRAIEDGQIVSTISDKPFIRIQEKTTLTLPLSTTIGLKNKDMFRVRSDLILQLDNISIYPPNEQGALDWGAEYRVKEIRILQTSSSRNFQKIATRIDEWISNNTEFIESILSTYLSGTLPVKVNKQITWNNCLSVIPNHQKSSLTFHFFPHFNPTLRIMP